ncbi:hypothetical protein EV121DRAFT_282784 [Schizophyllum commune]
MSAIESGQSTPGNPAPDLTPKGLLNDDGNYILQQDDMYSLLKYVCAGLLLPVTDWEYIERLQLSQDTIGIISSSLEPLIATYVTAQGHCEDFRRTTYPGITAIASDVYDYAQIVCGKGTSPFFSYSNLIQRVSALSTTAPEAEQAKLRLTIKNITSYLSTVVGDIATKLQGAVNDLNAFEQTMMQDMQSIQQYQSAIVDLLQTEEGDIQDLQAKVVQYQAELTADEATYEHDLVVACSTPSYAWIPFIGIFVASAVATIYGEKAAAMANVIGGVKQLISNTEGEIADEKGIAANLAAVESDVSSLLATMTPAITVIQKMIGVWQAISGDLDNLQQMVETDVSVASAAIAEIVEEKLVERWSELAEAVTKYQQAAVITDAQLVGLDELASQLSNQVVV